MKPHRDEDWIDYIKSLRCAGCGTNAKPRRPHHIRRFSRNAGTSIIPADYHCIPLCDDCHESVHHGYGDLWPQIMEAWLPLLIRYLENTLSIEEAF